jgi:hypothetical protein
MKINTKIRSRLVGLFIITAYGVLISEVTDSRLAVFVTDAVSGWSVIGIAALLFPYFKAVQRKTSYLYLLLKITEGGLMILGGAFFLSRDLQGSRNLIYDGVHLYVFIISGYLFYYLIRKSQIVPKLFAYWGYAAISVLLFTTLFKLVSTNYPPALDTLLVLIITNEIALAVWFILKGFNPSLSIIKSTKVNRES